MVSQIQKNGRTKDQSSLYINPLNLAICKSVDPKIVVLLAEAGPHVLLKQDGQRQERSLSILLRFYPKNLDLIGLFLLTRPQAAQLSDWYLTTALHVACRYGSPSVEGGRTHI